VFTEFDEMIATEEMTGPLCIDIKHDKLKKMKKPNLDKTTDKPRKKKKLKVLPLLKENWISHLC